MVSVGIQTLSAPPPAAPDKAFGMALCALCCSLNSPINPIRSVDGIPVLFHKGFRQRSGRSRSWDITYNGYSSGDSVGFSNKLLLRAGLNYGDRFGRDHGV